MPEYITGKEAKLILGITTRQQLHNIVKKMDVQIKSQGAGKPNLYLKTDIENYAKRKDDTSIPVKKRPRTVKKAQVIKKRIDTKKVIREEQLKNKAKPAKKEPPKKPKEKKVEVSEEEEIELPTLPKNKSLDNEDFTPLNRIGQAEFLRVERLAKKNGTYEDLDQSLLLFYAISYQKYINAVVKSDQLGDLTMNDAGDEKVHPYFLVAEKCFNQMTKIARDLGLGVRNRIGLDLKKEKKQSMMDILADTEDF